MFFSLFVCLYPPQEYKLHRAETFAILGYICGLRAEQKHMYQAFIEGGLCQAACLEHLSYISEPVCSVNPLKQIKAEQMTALPAPAVYTSVWETDNV